MQTILSNDAVTFKSALLILITSCLVIFITKVNLHLPIHTGLILNCWLVALWLYFKHNIPWHHIKLAIHQGIQDAIEPILILLSVGALVGTWSASGTISTMISYGLNLFSSHYFLPSACIITAIVSLMIGSSWTTVATVGVALIHIGDALGLNLAMCAGAIISGAYFGDKLSPLSDTTVLSSGIAKVNIFNHIANMLKTTLPAYAIAICLFFILNIWAPLEAFNYEDIQLLQSNIQEAQQISIILLLPLVLMLLASQFKMPAIPVIHLGIASGIIIGYICQPISIATLLQSLYKGFECDNLIVKPFLSKGGIINFAPTVLLIILATTFAGILKSGEILQCLVEKILKQVSCLKGLISATMSTSIMTNILLADQYLSIIVPGKMFQPTYEKYSIDGLALSKSLEDAGTMSACLIPWNVNGAFMAAALGVATLDYLPYVFGNIIVITLAFMSCHFLGHHQKSLQDENTPKIERA